MTVNKRDAAQGQEPSQTAVRTGATTFSRVPMAMSTANLRTYRRHSRPYTTTACGAVSSSALEVRLCPAMSCPLWPYRFGRNPTPDMIAQLGDRPIHPLEDATTAAEFHEDGGTGLKAIKRRCLDCSGYSKSEVRDCRRVTCDLHPFRSGKNPNRAASPEQREIKAARLKANITRKKNRDVG